MVVSDGSFHQELTRATTEAIYGGPGRNALPRSVDRAVSRVSRGVSSVSRHVLPVQQVAQANLARRFAHSVLVVLPHNDFPIMQDCGGRKRSSTLSGRRGAPE